jgi:hypothetical protein
MSDELRARAVEALLDYDFEQTDLLNRSIDFFKSFYIFGTAVGRVDYFRDFYKLEGQTEYTVDVDYDDFGEIKDAKPRKVDNSETVIRYDGPRFTPVSLFDFFPDPMFPDLENMRYVVEREETTIARLKFDNKRYKSLTGKNLYKGLKEVQPFKEAGGVSDLGLEEDLRQDTAEIFRFSYGWGSQRGSHDDLDQDAVIIHHYWEDDRYIVLANGQHVIRDGKNPYNDKRKPYVVAKCFPTLQEFYGQGMVSPIQYLQEELNTIRNIAMDQGKLNLYGVWAIDDSLGLADTDLALFPGKIITTEFQGGKPGIQQVFDGELPSDFERLENRVQRDIQSTLAINDYMIGAGSGSAGTASEANMLQASAQNRFRLQATIAQEQFLTKMASMFLSRRQQFLDEKQVFRIMGEAGFDYPEIGPEEIAGKYDFIPLGSQSHPNKEVTRQQLMQLVPIMSQNPILMQQTNWKELHKELFNSFDFRWPERFIVDDPMDTMPQSQENYILLMGEEVRVRQTDNHQEHFDEAQAALEQASAIAAEQGDERPMKAVQKHLEDHGKYLSMMQGGGQPQGGLPTGPPTGAPGNQPTNPKQSTPSMGSMQAAVTGGTGGPTG